ncbi:MAG: glycosyltransferase, partial [Collinsella sp.]|nr:glycosyltransferase [Collinsella sp.]
MTDKMTVAIAAGGTAGHINPALALAEELRDRGHHVAFVGQSRKLEGRLVPEAGFDFVPITVTGFDRSRPWTALTSLWRVNKAKR